MVVLAHDVLQLKERAHTEAQGHRAGEINVSDKTEDFEVSKTACP